MRQIHNVHERVIEAPVDTVAALFDRVSSADDPVFPTPAWPPMRFDRPLSVGAVGGHGRIRYSVVGYEPGHRARFAFTPPANGYHELSVEPRGANASLVRHVLEQRPDLASWLAWVLVVRWAHNVIIEEVLDNFERAATGSLRRTTRWPVWVRLLHRLRAERPVAVSIPSGARLARGAFDRVDFSDAWQVELRPGVTHDLESWRGPLPRPSHRPQFQGAPPGKGWLGPQLPGLDPPRPRPCHPQHRRPGTHAARPALPCNRPERAPACRPLLAAPRLSPPDARGPHRCRARTGGSRPSPAGSP